MSTITTDLIKKLREHTQVGMMDCKKALEEANGDFDKAVELLRKKGAAVAAKRAENATDNGTVQAFVSPDFSYGSLVEVSCETDFSANTEAMQNFAKGVAEAAATQTSADIETLMNAKVASEKLSVKEKLDELIAKISENIKVKRFSRFSVEQHGIINSYIHPGATVGILVHLETDKAVAANASAIAQLAKEICMQIAVNKPLCVSPAELDETTLTKEREIIKAQLVASGKPNAVIEKIMVGKVEKFYEDVCLLNQKFIKNDKLTIAQHAAEVGKSLGLTITVKQFARFAIGK